ncbi:lipoprotein YedD [Erwinia sorbitola]|uniref:Lipoprotein n=1 Tax=Erwinia sorbitola TaxID=2681984 RepID=A0ABW9R613_9GAMM|nr:lipoprotein YedD [Erwinia sorbitola]MTD25565.1 lipoprotein [Erwinia sorbitola]
MKKWIVAAAVVTALSGCAQLPDYASAVKTPPPAALVGNWQTFGPQRGLVSDQAKASLIITAEGDTLDCRQWQRVIAKPGKITYFDGEWVNVNNEVRVMPLELEGTELHYDKLIMQKVTQLSAECQKARDDLANAAAAKPVATAAPTAFDTDEEHQKKHKMTYIEKEKKPKN